MAQITPQMVKDLRAKTGAGMGDCKKALVETDANMEAAVEYLRKKGAASAAKRADRSASEGVIATKLSDDNKKAVLVEINCETDFVAKNEGFTSYAEQVADTVFTADPKNIDELMAATVDGDSIEGLHNGILAKFSEKIEIRRFEAMTSEGYIATYIHAGSKLGVMLDMTASNVNDNAKALIQDIAMQIAAMSPQFVSQDEVTEEKKAKEKEIYREAAIAEGKKPEIADRVAEGKLNNFFKESCLLNQIYVKDSKKTVADVVKEIAAETGADCKINCFRRWALGEEID